jgi:predicted DNA-binding ribbon-helix-helix protein
MLPHDWMLRINRSTTIWEYLTSAEFIGGLGHAMKSSIVKHSVVVGGHHTSISLEDAFWAALKEIASERDMSVSDLVAAIDGERQLGNLSSAIRLFVLDFSRGRISEDDRLARVREMLASAIGSVDAH